MQVAHYCIKKAAHSEAPYLETVLPLCPQSRTCLRGYRTPLHTGANGLQPSLQARDLQARDRHAMSRYFHARPIYKCRYACCCRAHSVHHAHSCLFSTSGALMTAGPPQYTCVRALCATTLCDRCISVATQLMQVGAPVMIDSQKRGRADVGARDGPHQCRVCTADQCDHVDSVALPLVSRASITPAQILRSWHR